MMNDANARWECGSEFHWLGLPEPPFLSWPSNVRSFLLGRHAVAALTHMDSPQHASLWLPSYFCPEVADACRSTCELREYRDDPRWREPAWNTLQPAAGDFVLAVNYFGVREGGPWQKWRQSHPCVLVEDHTQDPFSPWSLNSTADYAFASLRKTLPVADGALLWSPRGLPLPKQLTEASNDWRGSALKMAALLRKADYLAGRGGDELKPLFRDLQARGEQLLRTGDISAMTPYTLAYIANGAPAQWRERRLQNASRLAERLAELKGVELMFGRWPTGAVPFTLLLMFESQNERDRYQLELQRHRIYCPVHWACQTGDADATDLSFRVLSLPIDQRYGESEMDRIADVIEETLVGGLSASASTQAQAK